MNEVKVTGLRELREALTKTIPLEMQGKVLQQALAAGTKLTVAAAKSKAPVKTGRLRTAIYALRDKRNSKPTYESRLVAVRSGKSQQKHGRDAFYWKFVEFGHRVRGDKKGGSVPANPFMRPAFESTKTAALEAIVAKLRQRLADAARKARF
jgi:HK97 gp10 family phage protein